MNHSSTIFGVRCIVRNGFNVFRIKLHNLFKDSMNFFAGFSSLFCRLHMLHSAFIAVLAMRISRDCKFRMSTGHNLHLQIFLQYTLYPYHTVKSFSVCCFCKLLYRKQRLFCLPKVYSGISLQSCKNSAKVL